MYKKMINIMGWKGKEILKSESGIKKKGRNM